MKTAFKLSQFEDGQAEKTEGFFNSREEAEGIIPAGFTPQGNTPKEGKASYFKLTQFNFPDLIADLEAGWEHREVVREYYYYK